MSDSGAGDSSPQYVKLLILEQLLVLLFFFFSLKTKMAAYMQLC